MMKIVDIVRGDLFFLCLFVIDVLDGLILGVKYLI